MIHRSRARLLRRARSIRRHREAATNPRYRCCVHPDPRECIDAAVYTTKCENCGATI